MAGGVRPGTSVVVPYYPSDEHRERAWRWVRDSYARSYPDWEVVEGQGGSPWVKAHAVADGLTRASGDVLVIADADVWSNHLDDAIAALDEGASWVIPHHLVFRLTREATAVVIEGGVPIAGLDTADCEQEPYPGWAGGGIVVVRRSDYLRAPLDPRFVGWGQEDASLAIALDAIVGHFTRLPFPLLHLWHPPQPRMSRRIGSQAGEALWTRYRASARRGRTAALVAEGAAHGHHDPAPESARHPGAEPPAGDQAGAAGEGDEDRASG
jgi:hypothetical protein